MEIDKIRAYLFQTVLVLASMSNSFFPSAGATLWQLLLKFNGGWQQILLIVGFFAIQLFGFQLLRILWSSFIWVLFGKSSGTAHSSDDKRSKEDHLLSRVQTLEARLITLESRENTVDARITAVGANLDNFKDRMNNLIDNIRDKVDKLKKD